VQPCPLASAGNELEALEPVALDGGAMGKRGKLIEDFAAARHSGFGCQM
jgi:hypothetical protein